MKSAIEIKNEMTSLQSELCTKGLNKTEISKIKKRFEFLKICKAYVETEPTHDFLHREKERLQNKIKLINAGYKPDKRLIDMGFKKEEQRDHLDYNKIMGLPKFKEQLRSINFMLS